MSVEINLNQRNIERLEALSGDKGLLTFFDTEIDRNGYVRQLFFPDTSSKIAAHYYSLSERNQQLIGKLVTKLAGGRDHHGFNLTLFFRWLTNCNDEGIQLNQSLISRSIANIECTLHTDGEIASGISKLKKKEKIKESQVQFEDLRDSLLFDTALIQGGSGYIDIVKPSILKEYFENPEIYMAHRKEQMDGKGVIVNQLKNTTIRKELERFAAYTGRKWEELVDRKYCVINYTCRYALLDESSRELVDEFIEVLYEDNKGAEMLVGLYQSILDGTIKADADDE